ncbi:hypothetical protein PsorP6_007977 [Peronosclerospora sorghi]|uniref:Uncharacterized protein n=1 Tax=Peronosclerospora sorghi TaxID=230839 RepID=A0ACC0WCJ1_9STRA|nr:hypothetical protein PsorP6_007977 [Peronosclerospora sorghi]
MKTKAPDNRCVVGRIAAVVINARDLRLDVASMFTLCPIEGKVVLNVARGGQGVPTEGAVIGRILQVVVVQELHGGVTFECIKVAQYHNQSILRVTIGFDPIEDNA